MTRRAVLAMMGVVLVAAGWSPAARAQAQGSVPTEAERRACERNGAYWVTASGYCKVGA